MLLRISKWPPVTCEIGRVGEYEVGYKWGFSLWRGGGGGLEGGRTARYVFLHILTLRFSSRKGLTMVHSNLMWGTSKRGRRKQVGAAREEQYSVQGSGEDTQPQSLYYDHEKRRMLLTDICRPC